MTHTQTKRGRNQISVRILCICWQGDYRVKLVDLQLNITHTIQYILLSLSFFLSMCLSVGDMAMGLNSAPGPQAAGAVVCLLFCLLYSAELQSLPDTQTHARFRVKCLFDVLQQCPLIK